MMNTLYGIVLKNLKIFRDAKAIGFDYLINPKTSELHKVNSNFFGAHNLKLSHLEDFIGIANIGTIEIHNLPNGSKIPIYDLCTGTYLGEYSLNKCQHCFGN